MNIKDYLSYDKDTGLFTWIKCRKGVKKNKVAGRIDSNGYITICFNYKHYLAHRLAWWFVTENWPKNQIDHENKIKADNRFVNLREATIIQNSGNTFKQSSTNKFKGVNWHKRDKVWRATCSNKYLGSFKTELEAAKAYNKQAVIDFGEFAFLNNVEL